VSELITTNPPTFLGKSTASFTTTTELFTLNGECDPKSKGLEWSQTGILWTTIAGGCTNGKFSFSLSIPHQKVISVRAVTEVSHTSSAVATITFVQPPTSPTLQVVTAGTQVDNGEAGVQFTMSEVTDGTPMVSATTQLDTHVTGIVYGQ
jgi:hypothetical protein